MGSFFRIERGLELDDLVQILQGNGVPGGTADTDAALIGSAYLNTADGSAWQKIANGSGAAKWTRMASEAYVNNAVGATVSWREPAVVRDNVATVVPTGTATAPIVVDGVSITDGQRVLFSAITGGNGKNVYIYSQASGTFTEDTNQESVGDAAYVQSGTSAGKTFIYNGTAWVQSDQASMDELGFLRTFIGKGASGSEAPGYSSTNFITQGGSLETAIGQLDAEFGANVSAGNYVAPANKVNANVQALDTAIGANVTAGTYISPASKVQQNIQALDTQIGAKLLVGNFITANQLTNAAITSLDAELGANVATGNFITAANKINANIQAIDTEIGANVTAGTYVSPSNKINANIQAIDTALGATAKASSVNNVTSIQTVDSVTVPSAKWLVRCVDAADSTKVYSTEVYATSNGVTSDYTKYGTLKIGTAITGLAVTVDFNAGALRLRVASTAAVNVTARRVGTL